MTAERSYYQKSIAVAAIFPALMIGMSVFFQPPQPFFSHVSDHLFYWPCYCLITWVAIWSLLGGCNKIKADEIGLILQFGRPLLQVSSGFVFVPFFGPFSIWELQRETRLVIEEQFPEDDPSKAGNTPSITITHGQSPEHANDALSSRITTNASIVCRYKIVDLKQFVTTIGNRDQLKRQIRDVVVTTAQVECARDSVSNNLARLLNINTTLKSAVVILTADWGIEIVAVLLQNIDLGGPINDALKSLSVAVINKEVNRHNAQKIFFEGAAHAEVNKAFAYAKAEGYKVIAKELNISESVVLYQIDALTNMWRNNNADVNLIGSDMADVFKMITAFKNIQDQPKQLI
ncbi:MAG: hypothetical protein HGB09_03910 [Chlorobiaceae bacterium]|nr:hypothetical protein [Chlorobiaceae bacterium]